MTSYKRYGRGAAVLMAALLAASLGTSAVSAQEQTGDLEIMSWWTSGGEAAALDELFAAFQGAAPDVNVVNAAVAGGGGSNAQAVLQTRLAGGNPPDSFQLHSGANLKFDYVAPDYLEPITELYESEGWADVIPAGLMDQLTVDGEQYAVLTNVHRGNGFWYNKPLLEENGITIGDALSSEEFFGFAATLQAAGIDPLCIGDSGIWASAQLFENTLAGTIGADAYLGLFDGTTAWDGDGVKQALETYGKYLDVANADHVTLSWDQAIGKVMEGSCAFSSMGDWAFGEFVKADKEFGTDFGWVAHPDSDGIFVAVDDGFGVPKGAANAENAKTWLKAIMSPEAQIAFNALKGGIPVRTDADVDSLSEYHKIAVASFAEDALVPTVVHGSAAPAGFQQTLNDAITLYNFDRNIDAFTASIAAAAENL